MLSLVVHGVHWKYEHFGLMSSCMNRHISWGYISYTKFWTKILFYKTQIRMSSYSKKNLSNCSWVPGARKRLIHFFHKHLPIHHENLNISLQNASSIKEKNKWKKIHVTQVYHSSYGRDAIEISYWKLFRILKIMRGPEISILLHTYIYLRAILFCI